MIRSKLIDRLLEGRPHLSHKDVEDAVEVILCAIVQAVTDGKRVELRNFGVFSASLRKAHLARNPKTGEAVQKGPSQFPKFKAGKPLQALDLESLPLADSGNEKQ